jgi:hypothetical protein
MALFGETDCGDLAVDRVVATFQRKIQSQVLLDRLMMRRAIFSV